MGSYNAPWFTVTKEGFRFIRDRGQDAAALTALADVQEHMPHTRSLCVPDSLDITLKVALDPSQVQYRVGQVSGGDAFKAGGGLPALSPSCSRPFCHVCCIQPQEGDSK